VKHGLLLPHQPESLKKKEMIIPLDVSTTLLHRWPIRNFQVCCIRASC
jgi:hypothetical protein